VAAEPSGPARPLDVPDRERAPSADAERAVAVDSPAPAGATSSRVARRKFVNWRTIAVAAAAIVVAVWVGRGVIGDSGGDTAASAGGGDTVVEVPAEKPPELEPVIVDGKQVQQAGSVVTLNPAMAQPGASINVSGFGFDPGSAVDLVLSAAGATEGEALGSAEADENGGFNAQVTLPQQLAGTVVVTAAQRNSDNIAKAEAVTTAGIGFVELGTATGKPGDVISVSARGFSPGETINVYWGRVSGEPAATLTADQGGGVGEAPVRVGTGMVGENTLVLVGETSGTAATAAFYLLGLYPTVAASPYAVKAKEALTLSGEGFAPEERVLIYVNASSGPPLMTAQADSQGSFGGVGFEVPYGLKGSHSLVTIGELSRTSVSSGFEILPYAPSASPSTYGGAPGTTFSFFAEGFGPDEVVEVYLGRGEGSAGELVTAFRVNDRGEAGAGGSLRVDGRDQGTLTFGLVGRDSEAETTVQFEVTAPTGPVDNVPPREKYVLPPELAEDEPGETSDEPQAGPAEGVQEEPSGPAEGAQEEPAGPTEG
jgi:hypothetical protein